MRTTVAVANKDSVDLLLESVRLGIKVQIWNSGDGFAAVIGEHKPRYGDTVAEAVAYALRVYRDGDEGTDTANLHGRCYIPDDRQYRPFAKDKAGE